MGVLNVNDSEFLEIIQNEKVIVKYYASWCGVCKTAVSKIVQTGGICALFDGILDVFGFQRHAWDVWTAIRCGSLI